jgi:hypothetical protein
MEDYEQAVFISYAWGGESEEITNQIDQALNSRGLQIVRDKQSLGYKGSISQFMERIGQGNCVIVVISDKYLRSRNCMYELVQIAENKQFVDRIFPVVLADARIYDPVERLDYVEYWEKEKAKLNERMKGLSDIANLQGINEELDNYDRFRDRVSGLTSMLKDMNTFTPEMHQNSNFSTLYETIEKRIKEAPPPVNSGAEKGKSVSDGAGSVMNVSAQAAGGLFALGELMKTSRDVRNATITFQMDFKGAHEQVDRLGDYKMVHDILHRLQFQCYNLIAQAAPNFPDDPMKLENLGMYALTMEHIADELKQVAAHSIIPKDELAWISDIDLAQADLNVAINELEPRSLKKVVERLKRILGRYPANINTLLNHSARELRLSELLGALRRVCDTLVSLKLDPEKVNTFQSGVEALDKLDQALTTLVEGHNRWQMLDSDLRLIEASIDRDLADLELWWPDIKTRSEQLYGDCPDAWAAALKKESGGLEEALTTNNILKVRQRFRNFQYRAALRFYQVDVDLKNLCDGVRQIGMPLASVLEIIE